MNGARDRPVLDVRTDDDRGGEVTVVCPGSLSVLTVTVSVVTSARTSRSVSSHPIKPWQGKG
jgi:hypothetical protein